MLAYEEAFAEHGVKVAQILLTHDDLAARGRFLNARNTLVTLLQWDVVPGINENDTVATDELKFGDNDNLAALICNLAEADLLVILTTTEGLYARDPKEDPDAPLLHTVEAADPSLAKAAGKRVSTVGRGGMLTKLQAVKKAAGLGLPSLIATASPPASSRPFSAGKRWRRLALLEVPLRDHPAQPQPGWPTRRRRSTRGRSWSRRPARSASRT